MQQQFASVGSVDNVTDTIPAVGSLAFLTARQVKAFVAETGVELPAWMENGVSRSVLTHYVNTVVREQAMQEISHAEAELTDNPTLVEVVVVDA